VLNLLNSVSETSTKTTVDLASSSHIPLPLELNSEVFKCLKLPVQRKFIWGLGRDIYGMFRQKLLKMVFFMFTKVLSPSIIMGITENRAKLKTLIQQNT
jgi:hypothetical protein